MVIIKFYKKVFEIFYWWFYNPRQLFAFRIAANYAWLAISPLTCFNILFFIGLFRIYILNVEPLPFNSFTPFWGLGLFALITTNYYFAFISGSKYESINIDRNIETKRRHNIFLILYIIISFGLEIALGFIARAKHF